jgi:nucleotide-binding universal stress UspA family protein
MHVMENLFLRPIANNPMAIEAGIASRLSERITPDDRQKLHAVAVMRKSDTPSEEIVRYAGQEGIDLIVMGTHGRVKVAHLLMGSVAEKVVRTAPCPVLTVRHPEREFVVPDTMEARHDRA